MDLETPLPSPTLPTLPPKDGLLGERSPEDVEGVLGDRSPDVDVLLARPGAPPVAVLEVVGDNDGWAAAAKGITPVLLQTGKGFFFCWLESVLFPGERCVVRGASPLPSG